MSTTNMNIMFFIIILVSTSFFSMATAEDGYIFKSDAATATSEKSSTGGSNKNSDSNISTGLTSLHLCASTLISIVLIICVTILLHKFGDGIIILLCFHMMMKSDDKKIINIHNEKTVYRYKQRDNNGCVAITTGSAAKTSNVNKTWIVNQQQPKRKPKMSKLSSAKKEKEELLQESLSVQLLSQIYDMTKSLLNDTREVIKMLDQDEETSKNSRECISTKLAALQKQKESQSVLPVNVSPGEAPESFKGTQACINHRNSHGFHSSNALDSKAGEQIKDYVDVPKETAPLLKNNSLRRITYDFNEIQSPGASNTINGSNNPDSTLFPIALITSLLLKSGNEATTVKNTYYIHNETYNTVEQNGPYAAAATGNVANVSNTNNKCPSKQQNTVMAASPKK